MYFTTFSYYPLVLVQIILFIQFYSQFYYFAYYPLWRFTFIYFCTPFSINFTFWRKTKGTPFGDTYFISFPLTLIRILGVRQTVTEWGPTIHVLGTPPTGPQFELIWRKVKVPTFLFVFWNLICLQLALFSFLIEIKGSSLYFSN